MAQSLRERLAAKAARRITLPIATSSPEVAHDALQRAEVALALHPKDGDPDELLRLNRERDAARAAYDDVFVDVEFQALPAADYEALLEANLVDTDDGEQEADIDAMLPDLVAASCVDESLQDAEWWRGQLGQAAWSAGDKLSLYASLVRLNTEVEVRAPKG